jgi:hypothetical protein
MADALLKRAFFITGVNLKSAAGTLIVPVISGKRFIPRACIVRIVTASGAGTTATVKLGNGGAFDIAAAQGLGAGSMAANNLVELNLNGSSFKFAMDIGTTGISFTVTVASTLATAHTCDVYLEGYVV